MGDGSQRREESAETKDSQVLAAVALTPHLEPGMGNLSVFPGAHLRDWTSYPDWKRTRTLPDLGPVVEIVLDAGDACLVHPLLPHRGGRNESSVDRDVAFYRVQRDGVDYASAERAVRLLAEPFAELPGAAPFAPD